MRPNPGRRLAAQTSPRMAFAVAFMRAAWLVSMASHSKARAYFCVKSVDIFTQ